MSQHDFEIANQGFPSFRSDLNSGLQALASNSAGATEPSTTYAYQFWYDETTDLLKMRNGDDDAWITLAYFDQTNDEWEVRSAVIQAVDSAGVTIKNDGGTTLIQAKDDGTVVFRTDDVTIDTSGNLLVGKTSSDLGTVGVEAKSNQLYVTSDASPGAIFNVLNSDSDILQLRKDGTTLGVLGTTNTATNMFVSGTRNSQSAGIEFGTDAYLPMRNESRSGDSVNLGSSSVRYKDLYLSGGVYLGGTTSANFLDDYEEGTWTPTAATNSGSASSFTTTAAENTYTKVGNLVTLIGNVTNIDTTGTTSAAQFQLSGLPFTPKSSNSGYFGTARYAKLSLQGGRTQVVTEVNASLNVLRFASVGGSNTDVTTVDHGDITDDQADFTFVVNYLTDS